MKLNPSQVNAVQSLEMLLRLSRVRVTRTTLQEKLWQHPNFPNLASLSDTLDELNVNNLALQLIVDQLPEIPLPALAYLHSEGGFFAPIRAAAGNVEWWHSKRGWQVDSLAQFTQQWDGVMLLIEPTERSGETNYAQSRKKELVTRLRLPFVGLSLLMCLSAWIGAFPLLLANAPLYYSLLALELLGILNTSLLVWYSLDANNAFLRSICQLNSRTNCSAVLHTSAARLFSWLSWAEVGLFYFGGCLLALLFFRTNSAALYPLLFGLSIATLPYTLWSVYYQWYHVRKWCVLCLTVQGLLWIQFGMFFYFGYRLSWPHSFGSSMLGLCATSFLILPALWSLFKPILSKALHTDGLQQSLQKIKFDQGYLNSLIQRTGTLPPLFIGMQVPTLGNPAAPNTLIVVSNPTCSLCPRIHKEIEQLMVDLEDVQCQFILATSLRPSDSGSTVASLVLSHSIDKMLMSLTEWYKTLHIKKWLGKSILAQATTEGVEQLNLHRQWCELAGINATPTIFFNGIEIPGYYTIAEYKLLINHLKYKVEISK